MANLNSVSSSTMLARIILMAAVMACCSSYIDASSDDKPTRTIEVTLNPDCDIEECQKASNDSSFYNLLYVKATGQNDVIHALYSSIDSFTILMFKTSKNAELAVNWTRLLSTDYVNESISLSEKPMDMCGYAFPIIYEFNDVSGKADMTLIPNNASFWVKHETAKQMWKKFDMDATKKTIGTFESFSPTKRGSFKFTVRYPGTESRDKSLPHMLLDSDASSLDFILDSLEPTFKDSKFGANIVFLTTYTSPSMTSKKTLDDEYTPGTFTLWNVEIADTKAVVHNFLQWKPIFYFYNPLTLENSTITKQYTLANQNMPVGIGSPFFMSSSMYPAMNISYGLVGDEKDGYFYTQTNYSSWTFSIGLGAAPDEKMSSIVTVVIIAGFGLPALVVVFGSIVMIYKKIKKAKNDSSFDTL